MADIGIAEEGIYVAGVLAMKWEEVDAARNVFRFKNKVLVKVGFSYSRGDWYDYSIFDKAEWENIKAVLNNKTAWYSDFAGKHSEAGITFFEDLELEEITDLEKIIEFHAREGFSESNLDIIQGALDQLQDNGEIEYRDGAYVSLSEDEDEDEE